MRSTVEVHLELRWKGFTARGCKRKMGSPRARDKSAHATPTERYAFRHFTCQKLQNLRGPLQPKHVVVMQLVPHSSSADGPSHMARKGIVGKFYVYSLTSRDGQRRRRHPILFRKIIGNRAIARYSGGLSTPVT